MLATRVLEFYDTHPGLGIWVTLERTTSAPVGFHLLNHPYGESCVQVGFVLAKDAWGRGFGTEMARALVRYGFAELALPRIIGLTTRDNLASQRVLTKIGLRRGADRRLAHPAYAAEGPMAWFERDRDEWLTG